MEKIHFILAWQDDWRTLEELRNKILSELQSFFFPPAAAELVLASRASSQIRYVCELLYFFSRLPNMLTTNYAGLLKERKERALSVETRSAVEGR